MDLVSDVIEGAVSTVGDITLSEPSWVSDSNLVGIPGSPGGLNYTHPSCPEILPPGTQAYYCIEGPKAMDGTHPISSARTFSTLS